MNAPAPVRMGLTPRQRDCFEAIRGYIERHGQSPSYDDLVAALNVSSRGNIVRLVYALRDRGWISFLTCTRRSIAIVQDPPAYALPPQVEAKLLAHCCATGENPNDVLADAVTLFFDEAEGSVAA